MLHKCFLLPKSRGPKSLGNKFLRCGAQTPSDRRRGHRKDLGFFAQGCLLLCLTAVLSVGIGTRAAQAAPPSPVTAPASAPTAIPDYGGRDSVSPVLEAEAPNPAAQAGRAVESLVVVLAGVFGVVYVLKRFGLVKPGVNGKPAKIALPGRVAADLTVDSPVSVVSSQSLPGGAMLHVVRVNDRHLLLAATPQTVTSITEWPAEVGGTEEASEFEDYLVRADAAPNSGIAAANARLRSLLSHPEE